MKLEQLSPEAECVASTDAIAHIVGLPSLFVQLM